MLPRSVIWVPSIHSILTAFPCPSALSNTTRAVTSYRGRHKTYLWVLVNPKPCFPFFENKPLFPKS